MKPGPKTDSSTAPAPSYGGFGDYGALDSTLDNSRGDNSRGGKRGRDDTKAATGETAAPSGSHAGQASGGSVKSAGRDGAPDAAGPKPRRWGTPDYERLGAVNRDPLDLRRADGTMISRFAKGGLYDPDGTRDDADILAREGIQFQALMFHGLAERALRAKINAREAGDPIDAPGLPSENEILDIALAHHAKLAVEAAMAELAALKAEDEEAREYAYVSQPPDPAAGKEPARNETDRNTQPSAPDIETAPITSPAEYGAALQKLVFNDRIRNHLPGSLFTRMRKIAETALDKYQVRPPAMIPDEAEMECYDNYNPDPDAHTTRRCRELIRKFRAVYFIDPDTSDEDLDAAEFARWVIREARIKARLARERDLTTLWDGMDHYIRYNLKEARAIMNNTRYDFIEHADEIAHSTLSDRSAAQAEWNPDPGAASETARPGEPDRHLPWDDYDLIMKALEPKRAVGAAYTRLWLQASLAVGLRPIEWLYTDIHTFEVEGRKRDFLVLLNAKISEFRVNDISRTIDISELDPYWRGAVDRMVEHGRVWREPSDFFKERRLVKVTLQRIQKKLWDEVRYSLYSCRRQFMANQKTLLNPVELAAVAGHSDTISQAVAYPGARFAWAAHRIGIVLPNPDAVFNLRSREYAKTEQGRIRLAPVRLPGNYEMKQIRPFLDAIERETPRPDTSPLKGIALG